MSWNLKKLTGVKDVIGQRTLFDTIHTQVKSLKNLGYETDRYGPLRIPIITSKIPDDTNLFISRRFGSADNWEVEIVLNALKTEITAPEQTVLVSKQGWNVRDEYFGKPIISSTLLSHQEKSPISCLFRKKALLFENTKFVLWKLTVSIVVNYITLPFMTLRKTFIVVIIALV